MNGSVYDLFGGFAGFRLRGSTHTRQINRPDRWHQQVLMNISNHPASLNCRLGGCGTKARHVCSWAQPCMASPRKGVLQAASKTGFVQPSLGCAWACVCKGPITGITRTVPGRLGMPHFQRFFLFFHAFHPLDRTIMPKFKHPDSEMIPLGGLCHG